MLLAPSSKKQKLSAQDADELVFDEVTGMIRPAKQSTSPSRSPATTSSSSSSLSSVSDPAPNQPSSSREVPVAAAAAVTPYFRRGHQLTTVQFLTKNITDDNKRDIKIWRDEHIEWGEIFEKKLKVVSMSQKVGLGSFKKWCHANVPGLIVNRPFHPDRIPEEAKIPREYKYEVALLEGETRQELHHRLMVRNTVPSLREMAKERFLHHSTVTSKDALCDMLANWPEGPPPKPSRVAPGRGHRVITPSGSGSSLGPSASSVYPGPLALLSSIKDETGASAVVGSGASTGAGAGAGGEAVASASEGLTICI